MKSNTRTNPRSGMKKLIDAKGQGDPKEKEDQGDLRSESGPCPRRESGGREHKGPKGIEGGDQTKNF